VKGKERTEKGSKKKISPLSAYTVVRQGEKPPKNRPKPFSTTKFTSLLVFCTHPFSIGPIYRPNSIIIGAWTLGVLHHANKFYSNRHISSHINSDQKTAKQPPKTQYLGLPNFQVCGLLYPCAFSDEGKIWHKRKRERERHPRSTLPRQISP